MCGRAEAERTQPALEADAPALRGEEHPYEGLVDVTEALRLRKGGGQRRALVVAHRHRRVEAADVVVALRDEADDVRRLLHAAWAGLRSGGMRGCATADES